MATVDWLIILAYFAMLAGLLSRWAFFFASLVVIPQWLQGSLGYTATWAGYATAFNGVAAVMMAPVGPLASSTSPIIPAISTSITASALRRPWLPPCCRNA